MVTKPQTIREFFQQFPNDQACLDHVMLVRYGKKSECPKCGKETGWSKVSSQRTYACQWCGHDVYPCVGTPFESSITSLQLWFYAIYLFTTTRSGVSAKELQRQLGVTYKCAWRMGHEIRKHMAFVDGDDVLNGDVEVDEIYVGGKAVGKRGRGADNKAILFGMLDRDGDLMVQVVENAKGSTLKPLICENVETGSTIHSDEWLGYRVIDKEGFEHMTCSHGEKKYSINGSHVNTLEGFWGRLKQSIGGTHTHVSEKHLEKYAKEFEYRYNSRLRPDRMMFELLSTFRSLTQG